MAVAAAGASMTTLRSVAAGSRLPRHELLALAAHATGLRRERLIADPDRPLDIAEAARLADWIDKRTYGEPLAYLIGTREFYGRSFAVDARVLIPRSETELLVDLALASIDGRRAEPRVRVLELGTGSGAIAVTLAIERRAIDVVATDVSTDALDVARGNAERLRGAVTFVESGWFDALLGFDCFDLVVSNPPYIRAGDPHLERGDLRFEPRCALTDGGDGLGALRRIVTGAARHLRIRGALLLEHGHDQAAAVRELMGAAGYGDVKSSRDLGGIERVTAGTVGSDPDADVLR